MTALICAKILLTTDVIIGIAMLAVAAIGIILLACLKKDLDDGAADEPAAETETAEASVEKEEPPVDQQPVEDAAAEEAEQADKVEEVAPEQLAEEKVEESVQDDTVATVPDARPVLNIPIGKKRTFAEKMLEADDENKAIYNMLKNEIMSYKKVSNRLTKTIDIFKFKGTYLAKISIAGKTVKLHLALDPNEYAATKYHQQDLGEKKKYEFVPLALKVKSDRSKKYAVELIEDVMQKAGLVKNDKYEAVDYAAALSEEE